MSVEVDYFQITLPGDVTLKLKVADPSQDTMVYLTVENSGKDLSFTYTGTNPRGSRIAAVPAGTAAPSRSVAAYVTPDGRSISAHTVNRVQASVGGAIVTFDDPGGISFLGGPGDSQH